MKLTFERVQTFDIRNLLGHDAPPAVIEQHADCTKRSTMIWIGKADGVEACAVGVIPKTLFDDEPYIWFLMTRICYQNPVAWLRQSKKFVAHLLEFYPSVIGLCECGNESGQRWLEWLGAEFEYHQSANGYFGFRITRWHQQ